MSRDVTYVWNLRNKTDEHRGREGKNNRDTNPKSILNTGNKVRVAGGEVGGGWAKWAMGTKEGTCGDEPWVLYGSDGSRDSTPEIMITLSVN